MRPHVAFLPTLDMLWTPSEHAGVSSKLLSLDPQTGARSALFRFDPAGGYAPPTRAFFSRADEEILVLKGALSFDPGVWLRAQDYCFYPAGAVHGPTKVEGETWVLIRTNRTPDVLFVDAVDPVAKTTIDGERAVTIIAKTASREWEERKNERGEVIIRKLVLGSHPRTGEGSMLLELMPGWVTPYGDHVHTIYKEFIVVSGEVLTDDGRVWTQGCYTFKPPFQLNYRNISKTGALLYISYGGELAWLRPEDVKTAELAGA